MDNTTQLLRGLVDRSRIIVIDDVLSHVVLDDFSDEAVKRHACRRLLKDGCLIGINVALGYLGVSRVWGIAVGAGIVIAAASTGSFRRFERFSLALCFFSLPLVPILMMAHPPLGEVARDLVVPRFPADAKLPDLMLLVIAIVGTTVAPGNCFSSRAT